MKISERLKRKTPGFSFEFFPPQTPEGVEQLFKTISELQALAPSFVSVTYGAGGSTRALTGDLVRRIKQESRLEVMAHLTCMGATLSEISHIASQLERSGVENILALRGDPPKGSLDRKGDFLYAFELVAYLRRHFHFSLGGAGYPEGHVECRDLEKELDYLRQKVDAGLDFVITQLFFENRYFYDFQERARRRGIQVPILPGIMPITNVHQVKRFTQMCGASIPPTLLADLETADGQEETILRIGINHATLQCQDLLQHGVPGIHFYTLNKSKATRAIVQAIRGTTPPS